MERERKLLWKGRADRAPAPEAPLFHAKKISSLAPALKMKDRKTTYLDENGLFFTTNKKRKRGSRKEREDDERESTVEVSEWPITLSHLKLAATLHAYAPTFLDLSRLSDWARKVTSKSGWRALAVWRKRSVSFLPFFFLPPLSSYNHSLHALFSSFLLVSVETKELASKRSKQVLSTQGISSFHSLFQPPSLQNQYWLLPFFSLLIFFNKESGTPNNSFQKAQEE